MLQQTSSTSRAQAAALLRPYETLYGDPASGDSLDANEDIELPQCKIKRNYTCTKCTYYTQNPRAFLVHTRDVHSNKFKIYDCPHCVYASRHQQKLVRHVNLVHTNQEDTASNNKMEQDLPSSIPDSTEAVDRVEDLLEKIEECDDIEIDIEECFDESSRNSTEDNEKLPKDELDSADINDKKKNFSCDKCNYVTHVRARYTKHIKYHFMPMIKCTICFFKTPYKWNLDRHMKNHGGSGSFKCTMCNFTADIRLSLTMHEMNHHNDTSAGHSGTIRRRNRVGASDVTQAEEMESLIVKEEEGSGDSHSSHSEMGNQFADIEMISCHSDSNDGGLAQQTKKEDSDTSQDVRDQPSPSPSATSDEIKKQNKKPPRPIPQLIPLNSSTPQTKVIVGEPPAKKFKNSNTDLEVTTITSMNSKETVRKKNNSFFDKLKERLLTETGKEGSLNCKNCGFLSKCLSEHSVHEKTCLASSNKVALNPLMSCPSSTRCQNCRHRCKSSADLINHMKSCKKDEKSLIEPADSAVQKSTATPLTTTDKDAEPHPMENVVFVWNNISQNNFEPSLDITIHDDSTLPENTKNFDAESGVDEQESMNLSPSQIKGKKIFKCPHCRFGASTASRFHVHIVGHLNKKPFECSLCKYKSNWQWDITKHIKLKSVRDPEHNNAKVLMTDETGRRNYSKYYKFLAAPVLNESGTPIFNEKGQYEYQYIDQNTTEDTGIEEDEPLNDEEEPSNYNNSEIQPLNLQTQTHDQIEAAGDKADDSKKLKKTLWKCKKCNYKDPSKEALLEHVREHSTANADDSKTKKPESTMDPADLAYRCGHCNQLSNWKHVIQRHCRLKHDGVIKVITTVKPKPEEMALIPTEELCHKCPFKATDKQMLHHHLRQHQPSEDSIFKCYFCPYFVKNETELMDHLLVHGVTEPEEYISKAMGCKKPITDAKTRPTPVRLPGVTSSMNKRHKCTECPYETNSKSQFMYHEQFHRHTINTPYKCPECNYSVSKRHLLHQHLRVHGIISKKNEMEPDFESLDKIEALQDQNGGDELGEIPYVWVSAKNEFHKMYKCRYCSYVNSQKCRIPYHENIHILQFENSELIVFKCMECKFTCDNAGRLAEHAKTHGEIYGRIYCPVETETSDEEQITKLRKFIEKEKKENEEDPKTEGFVKDNEETKILFFCQKCPARFFNDFDLNMHDKSHDLLFPNKCKSCEYSVPQETELTAHMLVHSDEYQTKTKMLKFVHKSHPDHKEPKIELVYSSSTSDMTWVVTCPSKNYGKKESVKKSSDGKHVPKQYYCKECPAKFFKTSALNYHVGLHGGEGDHKCKKCSYAVKNLGNLAKHEQLHETASKQSACDYESGDDGNFKNIPLSGTDLFQRKTEAQKKSLTDKDKLVKPNDHFPPVLQADPQFGYLMHGNPEFIYPTYLKNGRQKEKRYKCHKCPSAFEKREQYKTHLMLHGSKQRYKCELCDYSVKYYANYVQHMRKHQMNDEALAERKKSNEGVEETESVKNKEETTTDIKFAIKTMPKGTLRAKSDFQQFSVCDQQTLRLLQRRRSISNIVGDNNTTDPTPTKDRKVHMCLLCPYTNQRQDALTNHYRRHDEADVLNKGSHKCSYCDLAVIQSHFLRDHLKTHFNYHKNINAECFSANEGVNFSITKVDEESEPIDHKLEAIDMSKCKSNEEKIFVKISSGELMVE